MKWTKIVKADANDGWDLEDWEDLQQTLDLVYDLSYEIRNTVRGAYTSAKTYAELGQYMQRLGQQLIEQGKYVAKEIEHEQEFNARNK